jgi:DNA-3-methyladenine glycosylase
MVGRANRRRRALSRAFFSRDTTLVAREMLGAILECRGDGGVTSGRIVETEAYLGGDDPASHAVVGRTSRTEHLFGRPGNAYVYFIYGRYWCVNAVTERAGRGHAVLVRGIEPVDGIDLMRARRGIFGTERGLTNGPARLCLALGIDGRLNGVSLQRGPLVLREGCAIPDAAVSVSQRIGLTRAADWPLRYYVTSNPHVSRTPSAFSVGRYAAAPGARS